MVKQHNTILTEFVNKNTLENTRIQNEDAHNTKHYNCENRLPQEWFEPLDDEQSDRQPFHSSQENFIFMKIEIRRTQLFQKHYK